MEEEKGLGRKEDAFPLGEPVQEMREPNFSDMLSASVKEKALPGLIGFLCETERRISAMKDEIVDQRKQIAETEEGKRLNELENMMDALQDFRTTIREKIQKAAIEQYDKNHDGKKTLYPGITINIGKDISYNDQAVLDYCIDKVPALVVRTLDQKKFKTYATEIGFPENIVTVKETKSCSITSDPEKLAAAYSQASAGE